VYLLTLCASIRATETAPPSAEVARVQACLPGMLSKGHATRRLMVFATTACFSRRPWPTVDARWPLTVLAQTWVVSRHWCSSLATAGARRVGRSFRPSTTRSRQSGGAALPPAGVLARPAGCSITAISQTSGPTSLPPALLLVRSSAASSVRLWRGRVWDFAAHFSSPCWRPLEHVTSRRRQT